MKDSKYSLLFYHDAGREVAGTVLGGVRVCVE